MRPSASPRRGSSGPSSCSKKGAPFCSPTSARMGILAMILPPVRRKRSLRTRAFPDPTAPARGRGARLLCHRSRGSGAAAGPSCSAHKENLAESLDRRPWEVAWIPVVDVAFARGPGGAPVPRSLGRSRGAPRPLWANGRDQESQSILGNAPTDDNKVAHDGAAGEFGGLVGGVQRCGWGTESTARGRERVAVFGVA